MEEFIKRRILIEKYSDSTAYIELFLDKIQELFIFEDTKWPGYVQYAKRKDGEVLFFYKKDNPTMLHVKYDDLWSLLMLGGISENTNLLKFVKSIIKSKFKLLEVEEITLY